MVNNTGKYFQYAIGEIVLVVIGILIALQINNWNENDKNRQLNQKYLKLLKSDLELDTYHFEKLQIGLSKQALTIDSISKLLSHPSTSIEDLNLIIKDNFMIFKLIEDINLNTTTFKALQNSGRFDLLDSDLQDGLRLLNQEQNEYKEYTTDNIDIFMQGYTGFVEKLPITLKSADGYMNINDTISSYLWSKVNWPEVQRKFINLLTLRSYYISSAQQRINKISKITEEQIQLLQTKQWTH